MLAISRGGYHFGWMEMMTMPIRHLKRLEEIAEEVLAQERKAYET